MNKKIKRIITAAVCLAAVAAVAAGLTSCTDVDLEEFYLESLPDSSAVDEPEKESEGEKEPQTSSEDTETEETEDAPDTKPVTDDGEAVSEDTEPVEQTLPDTIYELSESELREGGLTAETLGDSDDSEAPEEDAPESGVYSAYASILTEYAGKCDKDPLLKPDFCRYYIADIDGDGIPELLAETGSCEADRTVYVYTVDGTSGKAKQLGSFIAWHGELGISGGKLGCETKTMGSYLLTVIDISGGTVTTERQGVPAEKSVLDEVLECHPFTDLSGIVGL